MLRFLDIYEHMVGGSIKFALSGPVGKTLTGQVDASNFDVVNEPRLRSIVSTAPQGDGRSLNEAVKREIDTSRVSFERGFAAIAKGDGALELKNGVLRAGTRLAARYSTRYFDTSDLRMYDDHRRGRHVGRSPGDSEAQRQRQPDQ